MKLNYKVIGDGPPLIILHGLMGMLDNWLSPAKHFANHFTVYLVDQRNHGHSAHEAGLTYQQMMDDLEELFDDLFLPKAHILGHSMGGKTAMKFAQNFPSLVDKLVVADIAPKAYPPHHQTILEALNALDFSKLSKRSDVEAVLTSFIKQPEVVQFLAKNVYRKSPNQLALRFNLEAINQDILKVGEAIEDRVYHGETLFIRGAKSQYVLDSDFEDIKVAFPNAQFVSIANAGHWLHAEQPEAFIAEVLRFLN